MIFARVVDGDYLGKLNVCIGALWLGPDANKFKGLNFMDHSVKYKPEQIKELIQVSENDKQKPILRYNLKLTDNKEVIIEQTANDKAFKCLILYH